MTATIDGAPARVAETSEAMVSYRDVGSGPVLLLLHGGAPAATGWGNFGHNVADLASDFRVVVPDQPGFGGSRLLRDSGSAYAAVSARAMIELLDGLGIDRAHVLGNSKGAAVALQMALAMSERVDRLVLVSPSLVNFSSQVLAPESEGARLLRDYFPHPTLDRARHLIRSFVYDPTQIPNLEHVIESRYSATLDPQIASGPQRLMTSMAEGSDQRSVAEQVSGIQNATLLMWGRDDKFCNLEDAFAYLSALPNSELVVFRDTGHWLPFERRSEFAAHLKAFLTR